MADDIAGLRTAADYQFGAGAGVALFPDGTELSVTRTNSGRPRQIHTRESRLATYGTDGRFRLGAAGGRRLHSGHQGYRIVVGEESVPHVREERNAFAKFVTAADSAIRPRDEVLVTHDGELLAVGRAELAGVGMSDFESGVAVSVREGVEKS
jgi:uncharacterized protein with predicted RNA binding PUA domain